MAPELWSMLVTLVVILGTVVAFVIGKYRSDLIALCALLCLMLSGVLTPTEALSGFSNSIILTIAGVFIIGGAIVRSGLAGAVSDKILGIAGSNHNLLFMLVMLITALIGALVSNTGTVAIMMPVVASMALSINVSPSRFLMPLAFMSSMGGMLTLIGNPPNMVVNDVYVKAGFPSLTLFSFFPIGVVCLVFGMFVLAPATSWYLARRKSDRGDAEDSAPSLKDLADKYHLAEHMHRISVPAGSSMIGQSLIALGLTGRFSVVIQEIRRKKAQASAFRAPQYDQIAPGPDTVIQAGDILYGLGEVANIDALVEAYQLVPAAAPEAESVQDKYRFDAVGICELVLMSSSRLVGLTVLDSGLREQYGITLLGIQRGDKYILEDFRSQVMQSGDALLVQGTWETIARLDAADRDWVVVGRPQEHATLRVRGNKVFVSAVVVCMIVAMALGILPTVTAVMLAALAVILGGCFRNMGDAYSFISWETLIMIAAMLPMSIAMEKAGLVAIISEQMTALGRLYGPYVALAVIYGVTSALNIIISFTPLTLLVAPVALQIALDLGYSPLPFMFAVATAASMCFASSFSTPSNALVVSAGRYTFGDYLKIGLPLQILLGIIMVPVLPMLFPF